MRLNVLLTALVALTLIGSPASVRATESDLLNSVKRNPEKAKAFCKKMPFCEYAEHVAAFGNTAEVADGRVLGRRGRGVAGDGTFCRRTCAGHVAPVVGDYARALANGVTSVPLCCILPSQACRTPRV